MIDENKEKELLEQGRKAEVNEARPDLIVDLLRQEASRIDKFIQVEQRAFRFLSATATFLIIAISAIAAYFIGGTVSELNRQVERTATIAVGEELGLLRARDDELIEIRNRFENDHKNTLDRWERLTSAAIDLQARTSEELPDAYGSYQRLVDLELSAVDAEAGLSVEDRRDAFWHLRNIIEAGRIGRADPNTLFNAGVSASRLEFPREAVELAVLAEHWQPTLSHRAFVLEQQNLFGLSFRIEGGALSQLDINAADVRSQSWKEILELIEQAPRVGAEQLYSRASNVAVRNRDEGAQLVLANTILESSLQDQSQLISYAWATRADLLRLEGGRGWRDEFRNSLDLSVTALSTESPSSTWYDQSLELLQRVAYEVDELDFLIELLE